VPDGEGDREDYPSEGAKEDAEASATCRFCGASAWKKSNGKNRLEALVWQG